MNKKLVAMILAISMVVGISTTTYASSNLPSNELEIRLESPLMQEIANTRIKGLSSCHVAETSKYDDIIVGEETIENVGVIKYVWINIQNFFSNIYDAIRDFISGGSQNQESNNDNSENPEHNIEQDNDSQDEIIEKPSTQQPIDKPKDPNKPVIPPTVDKPENKPPVDKPIENKPPVTPPSNSEITKPAEKPSKPMPSDKFMAQVEQLIFKKVNEERAKAGVPQLQYNTTMQKYARIKSQDMGDNGYFSHNDLQGNLITVKMEKDGVRYNAWGENIAYIGGVTDPNALASQFMTNWMNSSGHRANILSTNFTSIGIGVYKSGGKVYATQEFYR